MELDLADVFCSMWEADLKSITSGLTASSIVDSGFEVATTRLCERNGNMMEGRDESKGMMDEGTESLDGDDLVHWQSGFVKPFPSLPIQRPINRSCSPRPPRAGCILSGYDDEGITNWLDADPCKGGYLGLIVLFSFISSCLL